MEIAVVPVGVVVPQTLLIRLRMLSSLVMGKISQDRMPYQDGLEQC